MRLILPLLIALELCPALAAESTLRFGAVEVDPGGVAELPLMVRTDETIHGFSLAFLYQAQALALQGFRVNEEFVPADQIGYTSIVDRPEESYAVLAVLFVWDEPCHDCGFPPTPGDVEHCLGWLIFSTEDDVLPAAYDVQPQNWLGEPRIANTFSVQGGQSVLPSLTSGTVIVKNYNILRVRSTTVEAGQPAVVLIEVDHRRPIGGLQLSLTYDNSRVRLREDRPDAEDLCVRSLSPCGMDIDSLLSPRSIEQFVLHVHNDYESDRGWASCGMAFDTLPPYDGQVLPPGNGQTVLAAYFDVLSAARPGEKIDIVLTDEVGDPPVFNKLMVQLYGEDGHPADLVSVFAIKEIGSITVSGGDRVFRRGFVNSDGRVNIADAVSILDFLFMNGQEPPCLAAGDLNDDGAFNIADAVYLLGYLFLRSEAPPPPFDDCGADPTPDALDCTTATPGCG